MVFKGVTYQRRARRDDISAFEALFREYYAELVNYSFSFLHDMDASEEIVQDFFYNYWKNRKRINIKVSLRSYLYRSIRNNSLKYLDALAVRRKYADRIISGSTGQTGYNTSELEFAELNEIIEDTLSELPERCSRIFRMSRFDGLKYDEIAKELSVSVKTVEANMTRALRFLRERLKKYNESIVL